MSLSRTMRTETSSPLFRRLRDAMEDAGWSTRLPRERGPWMLAASKGSARYSVILEEVQVPRRSSFQGLLADAVLRGRAAAGPRGRFLVVVGAPLISSSMADSIEAYVGEVVPGQPFGYVDGRGLVRLFGPGLEQVRKEPARSSGPKRRTSPLPSTYPNGWPGTTSLTYASIESAIDLEMSGAPTTTRRPRGPAAARPLRTASARTP